MGFFSKSDFAAYCGVKPSAVSYALGKGKLHATVEEKKTGIDSESPDNKAQTTIWLDRKALKEGSSPAVEPPLPEEPPVRELSESQKLDLRKKALDVELKEAELDKVRLQRQSLLGASIPVGLAGNLFTSLGSSFQNSYRSQSENLLNELFHRAKVDQAIASEFRTRMLEVINSAHSEAIGAVKDGLKRVVEDEKRKIK